MGKVNIQIFDTTYKWLQEVMKETGKSEFTLVDEMVKDYIIFNLGKEKAKEIMGRIDFKDNSTSLFGQKETIKKCCVCNSTKDLFEVLEKTEHVIYCEDDLPAYSFVQRAVLNKNKIK